MYVSEQDFPNVKDVYIFFADILRKQVDHVVELRA